MPVGFSLDVHVDVDLVGRARHRIGLDVDLVEIAQAVDAVARHLDVARVVPGGFLLAHLRRTTSSRVRVLPPIWMRRTVSRGGSGRRRT